MAISIAGLVTVVVFYLVIVVVGIVSSRLIKLQDDSAELSMVAGRNLGVLIGIFTMAGKIKFQKSHRYHKSP